MVSVSPSLAPTWKVRPALAVFVTSILETALPKVFSYLNWPSAAVNLMALRAVSLFASATLVVPFTAVTVKATVPSLSLKA
jgi:hypothetical protein